MREYQTEQRKRLLAFFEENSTQQFTIDEVEERLSADTTISRSAIYRNVSRMVGGGLLKKALTKDGRKTLYQFADCVGCCERIHLQCERCGKVSHMEKEADEAALRGVLLGNGFQLDEHATMLVGVCKACREPE